ncbi:MAG: ammonium transporter [Limosilactobacillus fermentum]
MNAANVLFVMVSSILVFFMTPGLALFYGGLSEKKNVVNTFMSVYFICGVAVIMWIIVGYSLSFSGNVWGLFGNLHWAMFHHVNIFALTATKIPTGLYSMFQMMFAIITPALFIGAVVGRARPWFIVAFVIFWSLLVYYPLVHMVWGGGILGKLGTLDFAGGTVVHINAGVTALVLSWMVGPRLQRHNDQPANLGLVLIGTSILWLGWYGFNAGSALAIDNVAVQAMLTTTVATAVAMVAWQLLEVSFTGKVSLVGTCTGTVCGLVAITPAAGYVTISGAVMIGLGASLCSYLFVTYAKPRLHLDDTLDAFGCHGVSGIWGSIATGLFATSQVNSQVTDNGLLYGGGMHQFLVQIVATLATMVFTGVMCWLIIKGLRLVMPVRVSAREEAVGLDITQHGERIMAR